jgi:hypothetical protein
LLNRVHLPDFMDNTVVEAIARRNSGDGSRRGARTGCRAVIHVLIRHPGWLLLLLCRPAVAASLQLCVDDPAAGRPALQRLERWLPLRLSLARREACDDPAAYRGRFVGTAQRVVFVLTPPAGKALQRGLPWLERTDAALQRLAVKGRLSEFSLVVLGLIAEHRLAQRAPAVGPDPPRQETPAPAQPPPLPSIGAVADTGRPRRPLQRPELDLDLAGRWRSSSLLSAELALSVSWYGIFARIGYQPAAEWTLEDRPVRVQGLPLALGWRPTLWTRGGWRLAVLGAARLEHSWLRRLDLEQARTHTRWDLGAALGLRLARQLARGWRAALRLEGSWFPAGARVAVPEGPSERLSALGIQVGLGLGWGGPR